MLGSTCIDLRWVAKRCKTCVHLRADLLKGCYLWYKNNKRSIGSTHDTQADFSYVWLELAKHWKLGSFRAMNIQLSKCATH